MNNGRIRRPETEKQLLSLPRVGFLKVGLKDEKGKPQGVDYFISGGKYAGMFKKVYGDRPQVLQIVFPSDDASIVCNERYEYRDDEGRLIAWGDGEVFNVWDGSKYQELTVAKYPKLMSLIGDKYPNYSVVNGGDGWRIALTLNFLLPMIKGIAGLWTFTTSGTASTIPQIRDVFDKVLEKKGFCRGVLFDLSVEFAKSQKPGSSGRYPVVSLVPNESKDNIEKVKGANKNDDKRQ